MSPGDRLTAARRSGSIQMRIAIGPPTFLVGDALHAGDRRQLWLHVARQPVGELRETALGST
jgi:hypothetical protein